MPRVVGEVILASLFLDKIMFKKVACFLLVCFVFVDVGFH